MDLVSTVDWTKEKEVVAVRGPGFLLQNARVQIPTRTLSSCVTSTNKLLRPSKTSLSSLWANKEMVLPQRVVGMSTWDKAWKHLALYLMMHCLEC